MLWKAGQDRLVTERRSRMAETYAAVRDGQLAADIAAGRVKTRGDARPAYVRDGSARNTGSRQATVARLAAMFPGVVTSRPS